MKPIHALLALTAALLGLLAYRFAKSSPRNPGARFTQAAGAIGLPARVVGPGTNGDVPGSRSKPGPPETAPPAQLLELRTLAETDPGEALERLETFLAQQNEAEFVDAITWFVEHGSTAGAWVESLPESPFRNVIVERFLAAVTARNPEAALALAEDLKFPEIKESALASVLRAWASMAPADAFQVIADRAELRASSFPGIAFVAAATTHPDQIPQLLSLIQPGTIDKSFFGQAAEALLAKDPKALSAWYESVTDETQKQAICERMVFHSIRNHPTTAFAWAAQLGDPAERGRQLQSAFRSSVARTGDAQKLLRSSWLSDRDRAMLPGD